jgi:hypothetical protein
MEYTFNKIKLEDDLVFKFYHDEFNKLSLERKLQILNDLDNFVKIELKKINFGEDRWYRC